MTTLSIYFAGDSGDGMQLVGQQFTLAASARGLEVQTLPDFPAEIRAPLGTVAGVSGFQASVADADLSTTGDLVDVLVAMNPAALLKAKDSLKPQGLCIINSDEFSARDYKKAGCDAAIFEQAPLNTAQCVFAPITTQTVNTLFVSLLQLLAAFSGRD